MNKISISAILLTGLALASTPAFSAISTFDVDSDGWVADSEGDFVGSLSWLANGGNPDGHVQIVDVASGPDNYFVAPTKFLGNQSGALGSNLTFDLKWLFPEGHTENPYYAPDVVLKGNGLTAVFATGTNPLVNVWNSYSIPLVASSWKLNSLDGNAVSEGDFADMLANLSGFKIRAEFRYGNETAFLDNVKLASVPVPPALALFATGLIPLLGAFKRKRSA